MKIDIGILAHNEEDGIAATIASIAAQSIFRNGHDIRVHCIVNGSEDATAAVAHAAGENHFSRLDRVEYRVIEIPRPGKSAAWNDYIHQWVHTEVETVFLADADITFDDTNCMQRMAETLTDHPHADVCVDIPLKNMSGTKRATELSRTAGALANRGPAKICGQLYCARHTALAGIVLPVGLMVEDGFLRACIATKNFTAPEDTDRIIRAEDASHLFDAFLKPGELFAHERRIVYGTAVNAILFGMLRRRIAAGESLPTIIAEENKADSDWVRKAARRGIVTALHVPVSFAIIPFIQLRNSPKESKIKAFPAALIRSVFSLAVAAAVYSDLLRGRAKW